MRICFKSVRLPIVAALLSIGFVHPAFAQEDATAAAIRKNAEQLAAAFNAGKAELVAGMFLPKGELIDEAGTIHQGTQEIKDLLAAFFKRYPGTKLTLNIESIRPLGTIAFEDGTRTMAAADGKVHSQFRYTAVWSKSERGWQIASFRDFADNPVPTPHENLEPVAWLVGDWINEGADGKVAISYRWSDDKNFLLGEFQMMSPGGKPRKSLQRIGWDPSVGRIRSWLFDADGGFAEGAWTLVADGIVIKSSSVNPDGTTSSVTMNILTKDKDHFTIQGKDRIIGDSLEDDFEITVARRPPVVAK